MRVATPKTQALVEQAVKLLEGQGQKLPTSLEGLAREVSHLDFGVSFKLDQLVKSGDAQGRVHFQRIRQLRTMDATAQGAADRHKAAGASMAQGGLYFAADLHAMVPKKTSIGPGFTPMNMSRSEKARHEADLNARAELAKRSATENLTPAQQQAAKVEIAEKKEEAELVERDISNEEAAKQAKFDKLPFIIRVLVGQIEGWRGAAQSQADGKVESPSLIKSLLGNLYAKDN